MLGLIQGRLSHDPAEAFVSFVIRVLLSLLAAVLLYAGMVAAFHLLNLPSDGSVLEGISLLLILAAGGMVMFRRIW